MKTPLGYAATTGLKSSDVAATDWEIVPQSRRDEVERRAIMKLEPGHFYESRGGDVWCCYKSDLKAEKHCCAYCVRVSDGRIEYFFADGRYDEAGKREHTLLREVKS